MPGALEDHIPDKLLPWIDKQEMFFVGTAPLSASGHINLSPKGVRGSLHVANKTRVWYEDLSGSGIETISHLRENGRITIMFCAFEGAARIVRLFGTGTVHEFGTPEYDGLIPPQLRLSGSRAAIVVDVYKVTSSCGFAVPLYSFKSQRTALFKWSEKMEQRDVAFAGDKTGCPSEEVLLADHETRLYPTKSMQNWWARMNLHSLDNLPGLSSAHLTDTPPNVGLNSASGIHQSSDVKSESGGVGKSKNPVSILNPTSKEEVARLVLAFSLGIAVALACNQTFVSLVGC